jgi:hypothetical protein
MINTELKYNFVFIMPNQSDLIIRYNDLNNTEYSKFIAHNPDAIINKNIFLSFLFRSHTSKKINKIVKLPLKNIWNKCRVFDAQEKLIFKNNTNPICFIIAARYFEYLRDYYRNEFIQDLRKKYSCCKIVLYYLDILSSYSFNIKTYIQQFDMIISFDKKEALNNNFIYYQEQSFSAFNVDQNPLLPQSDIVFIGKGKSRLNEIIEIFELLHRNGLICDFHIIGIPISKQKYSDKINFHSHSIPYYEILQHVISSKCILEILQDGGTSHTARVSEAIFFGKKLLSNCHELNTKPYYNPEYISIFTEPQNINIEFIKKTIDIVDYNYKQNLSPLRLIEFIDNYLNTSKNNT